MIRWHAPSTLCGFREEKKRKSVENVLCSSKNVSIFAADFAAHVLLTKMLMR